VASPLSGAAERVIVAPFQFQVTGEDNLRVRSQSVYSQEFLEVSLRRRDTTGQVQVSVHELRTSATPLQSKLDLIALGAGYLLNLRVGIPPTLGSSRGTDTHVTVDLVRGFSGGVVPLGSFVMGYVRHAAALAWPGTPLLGPLEGDGFRYVQSIADPAAGAGATFSVAANLFARVQSVRCRLVTSAVVATRTVLLQLAHGGVVTYAATSSLPQVASQNLTHHWYPGGTGDNAVGGILGAGGLPPFCPVWGVLDTVTVTAIGLQAADQFSDIEMLSQNWINP
jgi:hypothetical protein